MADKIVQLVDKNGDNVFPVTVSAADNTVTSSMLQSNSVTTAKVVNSSITNDKIADNSIAAAKFAQYAANNGILTANNLTPTADTTTAWITLLGGPFSANRGGYWATYYNQSNCFASQPYQYGWLETIIEGTGVYQRFTSHASGRIHYRMGNATGWWSEANNAGSFRQVFDRDEVYTRSGATEIYSNVDLNTINYSKPGKYFCRSSSTASTLSNCPVSYAFSMEVFNVTGDILGVTASSTWTYLVRVLTDYLGNIWTQSVNSNGSAVWSYGDWLPQTQVTTVTATDPGEGSTLAANHFIAVYS